MSTIRSTKLGKGIALTPAEQQVYHELLPRQVVTLDEVARILGRYDTARQIAWRLRKKGYFRSVMGGLFIVLPPELRGRKPPGDPVLIAAAAARKSAGPYYLSHHTGLELNGIAH